MHQWVLNVAVYWLALLFIIIVNNISVIFDHVTKIVTQKKDYIYRFYFPKSPLGLAIPWMGLRIYLTTPICLI